MKPKLAAHTSRLAIVSLVLVSASDSQAQSASRSGSASQGMSVAQAIRQAQQTGQPIFAVAGANHCPACKVLLNTLRTDESLHPLINEFVALKINAQSDDYARWKQFFPPERSAIPALFIVTPQGKQLFGKVGALPSQNLNDIMLTSLEKAGRYPTKEQWQQIAEALESAEELLQDGKAEEAIALLQPLLEGMTRLGSLVEYTAPGRKAKALVEQFEQKQQVAFDEALTEFSRQRDLPTALRLVAAERLGTLFPQLRRHIQAEMKRISSSASDRKLLCQARDLHEAVALSEQEGSKRKAVAALKRVVKRHPGSPAAAQAEQHLRSLGEGTSDASAKSASEQPLRTWSDKTGRFSIKARLLEVVGDRVRLQQADGKLLSIRISQLDEAGRRYIAEHQSND